MKRSDFHNRSQSSPILSSQKSDPYLDKKSLSCGYCIKKGHIISGCFRLQRRNGREPKPLTSGSCGFTAPLYASKGKSPDVQTSMSSFCDYMEDYKPFMSEGFVSIDDNTASKPIRIIRDTGASRSLLLEGVLPLSENTSVGATVLLQGVELGCFNVPLHRIYLKSDFITGPVIVGVRHNLPFEGVSLLLGNDLAGKKVVAEPIVTNEPAVDAETSKEDTDIYQACAVTRAMEKKEKQTSCEGDPFDLSDMF